MQARSCQRRGARRGRKNTRVGCPRTERQRDSHAVTTLIEMALGSSARTALSRAAVSCLRTRASSATACSVATRLRCSGSSAINLLTGPVSGADDVSACASNAAASGGSRRKLSTGGDGVDYSSLMAGPGTALHNDIMESAARKQTG